MANIDEMHDDDDEVRQSEGEPVVAECVRASRSP